MRGPERSRQEIDPVGTFSSRHLTLGSALLAFLVPTGLVLGNLDLSGNAGVALLALICLASASIVTITATDPYRGPFYRGRHGAVIILVVLAAIFVMLAARDTPASTALGWVAPSSLGLLMLAMAPYRPVHEILANTVLSAVFLSGILVLQHGSGRVDGVPTTAIIGVQIFPLLALGISAAYYTDTIISAAERWRREVEEATGKITETQEDGIARSVQKDRVTILNREVVPFFEDLLATKEIPAGAPERAAQIADSIRKVMVAEVDRTWLENVLDHLHSRTRGSTVSAVATPIILDEDHVANQMDYDQRTAMRAFLVALYEVTENRPEQLEIRIARDGDRCRGYLTVALAMPDVAIRTRLGPYLTVMRVVFRRLRAEFVQSVLTVRFVYDQR